MTGGLLESFLAGDSTELLVLGATSWASSGPLPSPRQVLRAVTLDNKIFVTGTYTQYTDWVYMTHAALALQGALVTMMAMTTPSMMIFWSLTRQREFGRTLEPCQSKDTTMQFQR